MFKIINHNSVKKSVPEKGNFVHPFYRDTFAKLYGVDAKSLITPDGEYPQESTNLLLPILSKVIENYEDKIRCFYDVRISEEFGSPAPEYLLLKGTNLNKISPLSVKGMKALSLPFALLLAEHELQDEEYGLFCCADLNTPFDNSKKYEAGVLLLQKINEENADSLKILTIYSYNHDLTKEDLLQYEKEHQVLVIDAEEDDLSILFSQISRFTTECIITWNTLGRYGYIHLRKGEA